MRKLFVSFYAMMLSCFVLQGTDFQENFSDSAFNDYWTGDTADFAVDDSLHLCLDAPEVASSKYLAAPSAVSMDASWTFKFHFDFNPSGSNFARVYLISDQADLGAPLNGYYLMLGDTEDEISLYRQDGDQHVKLIDGRDDLLDQYGLTRKVKVTRQDGLWELYVDSTCCGIGLKEGDIIDSTYIKSAWMGVYCQYTKTRSDGFWFDDFHINGAPYVDSLPPVIDSFTMIDDRQLMVYMDEPVSWDTNQPVVLFNGKNTMPDIQEGDGNQYLFQFADSFIEGRNQVDMLNLYDTSGNQMDSSLIQFDFYPTSMLDVLITEVMEDPSPVVGLPEYEYIELYNATGHDINLKGWKIETGRSAIFFPEMVLPAGAYLIVCDQDADSAFSDYGLTAALFYSSRTLANSGQEIILKDSTGQVIHYVEYRPDDHESSYKMDGGWSLEMIDPGNPCVWRNNWASSVAAQGGTPGTENSVFDENQDNLAPALQHAAPVDDSSVALFFSEPLVFEEQLSPDDFSIVPSAGQLDSIYTQPFPDGQVKLFFDQPFLPGETYQMGIETAIQDCYGNITESAEALFALTQQTDSLDVIINEVLFNPVPYGADYVELYNRSAHPVDLEGLKLCNRDEQYQLTKAYPVTTNPRILFPGDYALITTNSFQVQEHYFNHDPDVFSEVTEMPAYNDDEGRVVLITGDQQIIDEFAYAEDMHYELLNETEAFSLERIHPDLSSNDPSSWFSAAETAGGGTPGLQNSQYNQMVVDQDPVYLAKDRFSPNMDGVDDQLLIQWSLKKSGYVGSMYVYDLLGRSVQTLCQNAFLEKNGSISWDGTIVSGRTALTGAYIIYAELVHPDGDIQSFKLPCVLVR